MAAAARTKRPLPTANRSEPLGTAASCRYDGQNFVNREPRVTLLTIGDPRIALKLRREY